MQNELRALKYIFYVHKCWEIEREGGGRERSKEKGRDTVFGITLYCGLCVPPPFATLLSLLFHFVRPWQTQPFSAFGFLPSSAWRQVRRFNTLLPCLSPFCCSPLSRHLLPGRERRLAARRAVNRRPIRRGCCAEIGTFRSFPFLFLSLPFHYAYLCLRFIVLELTETRENFLTASLRALLIDPSWKR